MSASLVLLWAGDLARARPALAAVRRRFDERGLDSGLSLLLARLSEAAILEGMSSKPSHWSLRSKSAPGSLTWMRNP